MHVYQIEIGIFRNSVGPAGPLPSQRLSQTECASNPMAPTKY